MMSERRVKDEDMKKVTGGANSTEIQGIIGMENYDTEQKACPKCGSGKLVYRTFVADDGVTTKIGQLCECGYAWTIGNKTGIR